ncbi:unnamed protein product [Hydatigera taeniaeformis]|uniref:Uncharacterized protein n=1 Tax=Hydatigena taeniaeformis TaxID=6205 RepID=A0A0R3WWJ4_HYDTA|nr:unnamed protein product [Hydatigera taeniaeformis]
MAGTSSSKTPGDSSPFVTVDTIDGTRLQIKRYCLGQKIVNWVLYIKSRLLYLGVEDPVKEVINALSEDALKVALEGGLDINADLDSIFDKLIEIFRFEGRTLTIWSLFSKRLDASVSGKDLVADIKSMTAKIFNRRDKENLIQETALDAFLNALEPRLARIMLQARPHNIDRALELLPRAKRLLASQTKSHAPSPPKLYLSSKVYEYTRKDASSQHVLLLCKATALL